MFKTICDYLNENNHSMFTEEEVIASAIDLEIEFKTYGTSSKVVQSCIEELEQNGSKEALDFIKWILEEELDTRNNSSDDLGRIIEIADKNGLYGIGDRAFEIINANN